MRADTGKSDIECPLNRSMSRGVLFQGRPVDVAPGLFSMQQGRGGPGGVPTDDRDQDVTEVSSTRRDGAHHAEVDDAEGAVLI